MLLDILLYITAAATIIQLAYWLVMFSKLAFYKTPEKNKNDSEQPPVSVIICAKNEAENLKRYSPRILNQNYRSFEVIVVNDRSTDNTSAVLLEFKKKFHYLRIIEKTNTKKNIVGKKAALATGIKAARHSILLLTDADCIPNSLEWLNKMQARIRGKIEIAPGYGPYFERKGFLNKFIRFETAYTATQYFSFALCGMPYMGVGRNLTYTKERFEQTGGFTAHTHIASGDDDLFINAAANRHNTEIILESDTFVYSEPEVGWKSYYRQKARHMTTGTSYSFKHQFLLGLLSLSHFLHYLGIFVLLLKSSTMFAGTFYMVRIISILVLYAFIYNRLQEKRLLFWVPVLDLCYVFYYVIFLPALFFGKRNTWT